MIRPWRLRDDGLELFVRVVPKAARDAVEGIREDAAGEARLVVRVTAPPDRGRANRAVVELLAGLVGVPKSAVTLVQGETSRLKRLRITGEARALERRLRARLGEAGERG